MQIAFSPTQIKLLKFGMHFVVIWLGLALCAYGLALRNLSQWQEVDFSRGEVRSGKVAWIEDRSWLNGEARFGIDDVPLDFVVPREFQDPNRFPRHLGFYLQVGTKVSLKSTPQGVVLELTTNLETPYVKPLVQWGPATARYSSFVSNKVNAGNFYLVVGLLLLPLIFGTHFFLMRRLRMRGR